MEPTHFESLYPEGARATEISKILEHIKSGKSLQLIGLPGSGRSNTLRLLSYNRNVRIKHLGENQKWFHFVYMDFSEVKKRDLYDVTKFILISLAYSLSERQLTKDYEKVNGFLKEAIEFRDELVLFQALKRAVDYLSIEKELTIVLLFDRFEQYTPDVSEQFFLNLNILRNRAKYRFSAIFTLPRPLEDILESSIYGEFSEFLGGNTVYLLPLDQTVTDFRLFYLEKVADKKADEKIKKDIVALTGGLGKVTRLAYEVVLSADKKIPDLKTFLLAKSTIQNALADIWRHLTPSEQNIVEALALPPLPRGEGGVREEANSTLEFLENIGLVKNNKITIPLFEEYVNNLPKQVSENFSYDVEKNEIYQGSHTMSAKLSPSEFRLFRYLLKNPGRVIEKDEIIQAVWKDTKTQEGVTDQALDQIIYRLRKKLEDDPNSPHHIQTVKGRGLRFTP